ncbi:unnamed protein product [Arctogadus glacialis]
MMPQSSCLTCGSQMPLQLLPLHVDGCNGTLIESEYVTPLDDSPIIIEQPVSPTTWKESEWTLLFTVEQLVQRERNYQDLQ